jgi:hypothetical protein
MTISGITALLLNARASDYLPLAQQFGKVTALA